MRVATLVGIVLILAGGYFLYAGGITTKREVVDVGPIEINAEEQHPVRPWIAGAVLLGGVALVVAGVRHKPS